MSTAAVGIKSASLSYKYQDLVRNTEDYFQPEADIVKQRASEIDYFPHGMDIGIEFEYDKDVEKFIKPEDYLEDGVGDCEDHTFAFGSMLEYMDVDWRMTVEPGHTEIEFVQNDVYWVSEVGNPKDPRYRNTDTDKALMYSLDTGWEPYEEDWANIEGIK